MNDIQEEHDLIGNIKELLYDQKFGVLATISFNKPYTSLIAFIVSEDLKHIIFSTLRNTRKYNNLIENNQVSMLIDNRKNLSEDLKSAVALTIEGFVQLDYDGQDSYKNKFIQQHPHLKSFISQPECAIVVIKVKKYYYVNKFQNVQVFSMR